MMALALCAACAGDDRPPVRSASDAGDAAPGDAPPGDAAPDDAADGSRFVPAPHRPFPVLSRNDGGVLDPVRLVMILGPDEPLRDALRAFADAVPASAWLRETGGPYGVRMASEVVHLVGGAVPERMNRAALRAYVAAAYARQPAAAPDGHSVYLVVFPPGTHFQADDGGEDPCSLSGEHSSLSNAPWAGETTDGLAWAHRCALSPGQTELDALTVTIGHELIEAATDPNPPHGFALPVGRSQLVDGEPPWALSVWSYFQDGAVENADLCEGAFWHELDHTYPRSWSPVAAALGGDPCVPALPDAYFSSTTPTEWVTVPAGATAQVAVTGWSTGPRDDWYVTPVLWSQSATGFRASFSDGAASARVNNGREATLSVRGSSTPGSYAVFHLISSATAPRRTVTGGSIFSVPPTGDQRHDQLLGVHTTCQGCTRAPSCGDNRCDTAAGETCGSCPDDCGACGIQCGASNRSVSCEGGATCPSGAACVAGGGCQCNAGTVAATCDGRPCPPGGCRGDDSWCVGCGRANSTVLCPGGFTCPSFAQCTTTACNCMAGYRAVSCAGVACAGGNTCPAYSWWCEPTG